MCPIVDVQFVNSELYSYILTSHVIINSLLHAIVCPDLFVPYTSLVPTNPFNVLVD